MHTTLFSRTNTLWKTTYIQSQGRPIALSLLEAHPKAVTVLFYPGTMAAPPLYAVLLEALRNYGCNVVAIHPLSHGLSPRIKKVFTLEDILQNGHDAQIFAQKYFSGPLVVSGHSQGGILALAHACHNTRIAASFPIGTLLPHRLDAATVTRFRAFLPYRDTILNIVSFLARHVPRLPIFFPYYLELKRVFAHAHAIAAPRKHCRLSYPIQLLHSLFSLDLRHACTQGTITCPVVLLSPKNDALFPYDMMQSTLEDICAPEKRLIPIHGGGHLAPLSRLYAKHIATHIAASCAGFGLPLHITAQKTART